MDDREFDRLLMRVAQLDYSAGTEEFRDALLARCLKELDAAERSGALDEGMSELTDSELEQLSAAGDIFSRLREE